MWLLWEAYDKLRELTHGGSREAAKHQETCEKHGGAHKAVQGVEKLENEKQNVSHKVNHDCKSMCIKECAYVKLFLQIKNLKWSQKKNCSKSRSDCVVIETSMSVLSKSVHTRARKLADIE